jgi:hypothetical protein
MWLGHHPREQGLCVPPFRSKRPSLMASTVKNVEDVCSASRPAIVDQILPCRKAPHTRSDVPGCHTCIRVLSEKPETFGDAVNYSVRDFDSCQYAKISSRSRLAASETRTAFTRRRFHEQDAGALSPSPLLPFFSPARPSYSTNLPASTCSMLARTRRRMPSSCSSVRLARRSSAVGLARRRARLSSSSMRRNASRTTSLALL